MKVPFVDLQAQYQAHKTEIDTAIQNILDTSQYMMGPGVLNFEKDFGEYLGVANVVTVSDGTHALELALRALAVGAGDEVIVPAHTFVATAESVSIIGATPVFADVDPSTHQMTLETVLPRVTAKTKVITPVHLYGSAVDIDPILAFAQEKNIFVIEDAAQAHGTRYKEKRVGGNGVLSCFSFYPGKNLGTYGEGGAVATNDPVLAEKVRLIRDHGSRVKYQHEVLGGNFRMSGIEGAVVGAKLPHLEEWNARRRAHAAQYRELLAGVAEITFPLVPDFVEPNYHLCIVTTEKRDALQAYLKERDIHTGIHYPIPCHLQPVYASLGYHEGDMPHAEKIARETLSLPMYAELSSEQITYVCDAIKAFFGTV